MNSCHAQVPNLSPTSANDALMLIQIGHQCSQTKVTDCQLLSRTRLAANENPLYVLKPATGCVHRSKRF